MADPNLGIGMKDFLTVYEAHLEEVNSELIGAVLALPEVARAPGLPARAQLEEQTRSSHQLVRLAILEGQWGPLLERRKAQGRTYAQLGMRFQDWFQLQARFQSDVIPYLVRAFASDPERLEHALDGWNQYLFLSMGEISRAYFETLDRLATH